MKQLFILILLFAFGYPATNYLRNVGSNTYDLWDDASVILDSGEVDTATDVWDMTNYVPNDDGHIGTYSALSKDSNGTDSVAYIIYVDGMWNDGSRTGYWIAIDTAAFDKASTQSLDTAVINTVVGLAPPKYIRFRLKSDASKAAEKCQLDEIKFSPFSAQRTP